MCAPTDVPVGVAEVQCYNASGNLLASNPHYRPNLPSRTLKDMSKPTGWVAGDSRQHRFLSRSPEMREGNL